MKGLHTIRDSYSTMIWITGEAAAFLESIFPDEELPLAISRLIDREMLRTRSGNRTVEAKLRHMEGMIDEKDSEIKSLRSTIKRLNTQILELNQAATVQALPVIEVKPPQDNPISRLQEVCQSKGKGLPRYEYRICREGFSANVSALGQSVIGIAKTKKLAKVDGAIALLDLLDSISLEP